MWPSSLAMIGIIIDVSHSNQSFPWESALRTFTLPVVYIMPVASYVLINKSMTDMVMNTNKSAILKCFVTVFYY